MAATQFEAVACDKHDEDVTPVVAEECTIQEAHRMLFAVIKADRKAADVERTHFAVERMRADAERTRLLSLLRTATDLNAELRETEKRLRVQLDQTEDELRSIKRTCRCHTACS
jgi:hypothetical protein